MAKLTLTKVTNFQDNSTASAAQNANVDAIEAAVENTLSRDGTSPNAMAADLDMNSNRILNLPTPANASEAASKDYVDTVAVTAGTAVVTAFMQTVLDDTSAAQALTTLGFSTFVQTLLDDASAAAFMTTLGITSFAQTILDDADATAVLATIGAAGLASANVFTSTLTQSLSDDGAGAGPVFTLLRDSASPAVSDRLGQLLFRGKDSVDTAVNYGWIEGTVVDPTSGSVDGAIAFATSVAGTGATRMSIGQGLYTANATGGDKGADTINAVDFYRDGTSILGLFPNYITGLKLSNNGTDALHDLDIASGSASDSTNADILTLSSSLTKQLDAAWAVGTNAGGLDTGSIAGSSTYHVWLIKRSDTGVVDVLFSLSTTAPTMPTNYDLKRRIGSIMTNATPGIVLFNQFGDYFMLDTPVNNFSSASAGTSKTNKTMTIPTGFKFMGILNASATVSTSFEAIAFHLLDPDGADPTVSASWAHVYASGDTASQKVGAAGSILCRTSTSAQVAYKATASSANLTLSMGTEGWIDTRGKEGEG